MKLYYKGTEKEITVSDDSYSYQSIMGEYAVTLTFALNEYISFPIGTYCMFANEKFVLEKPFTVEKVNTEHYEYNLVLEGAQSQLKKYKLRNIVDKRLKFTMMAKPRTHLLQIVDNLNMRDSGWSLGDYIDVPEKLISYNHTFLIEALNTLASEFETEWEIKDKTIHLRKVEYNEDNPLPLSYGRGNGLLPNIKQETTEGSRDVEILFVQGGSKNIDFSSYGSHELLLPKNHTITVQGQTFVTDENGYSVRLVSAPLSTKREDSLDLSHIYPSRVGAVTSLEVEDAEKHFYNFIDNTIPEDLDYSQYLIAGNTMTVIFQSGMLNGKEFEISEYIHSERKFKIQPQDIDGMTMPNETFKPELDDKYAVFNMTMPNAYINQASMKMLDVAIDYLIKNKAQTPPISAELDPIYAKQNWDNISDRFTLGNFIAFSDSNFQTEPTNIRITGIKRYINNPYSPQIEMSNATTQISVSSEFKKIQGQEVVVQENYENSKQFAKLNAQHLLGKIDKQYLSAVKPDVAKEQISFLKSIILHNGFRSEVFIPGLFGEGVQLRKKAGTQNQWVLEIQDLIVNGQMDVSEIIVKKWTHVGAGYIFSPAGFKIDNVEDLTDRYRVYPKNPEENDFFVNDQALCQAFNMDATNTVVKRYWRLVIGVAADRSYIDLSKTDHDGDGIPSTGDDIIQLGHRGNDSNRKGAIIISSYGDNAPFFQSLRGIDSYDLSGKTQVLIGNETIFRVDKFEVKSGDNFYRVPADKGQWSAGTYNYYDRVSHNGSLWLCVSNTATTDEPTETSTAWEKQVEKGQNGDKGEVGEMLAGAKMLYKDPEFKNGLNGTYMYNHSINTPASWTRISKPSDAPTQSTYIMKYRYGGVPSAPAFGGFSFRTQTRANAVFITKIIAKIPIGRQINWGSNGTGTGSKREWLTSQQGTGKYETYIFKLVCGASGTFKTTNFFYFSGGANSPFSVYVAFATVYDATAYDDLRENILATGIDIEHKKIILTADNTFIRSNSGQDIAAFVVENGRPMLKASNIKFDGLMSTKNGNFQVNQDGTIKAVNGVFSGKIKAVDSEFSGKIKAVDSEFSGKITATSGEIGGFNIDSNSLNAVDSNGSVSLSTTMFKTVDSFYNSNYGYGVIDKIEIKKRMIKITRSSGDGMISNEEIVEITPLGLKIEKKEMFDISTVKLSSRGLFIEKIQNGAISQRSFEIN